MNIADQRRATLRAYIKDHFDGVARGFAKAVEKPESQINDMLSEPPRKAFGEKVARQFEEKLSLARGYFDTQEPAAEAVYRAKEGADAVSDHDPADPRVFARDAAETAILRFYREATEETREMMRRLVGFAQTPGGVPGHRKFSVTPRPGEKSEKAVE